jgi:hypothetical protein
VSLNSSFIGLLFLSSGCLWVQWRGSRSWGPQMPTTVLVRLLSFFFRPNIVKLWNESSWIDGCLYSQLVEYEGLMHAGYLLVYSTVVIRQDLCTWVLLVPCFDAKISNHCCTATAGPRFQGVHRSAACTRGRAWKPPTCCWCWRAIPLVKLKTYSMSLIKSSPYLWHSCGDYFVSSGK